ncbi:MAG: SMP-30/gluconolactonase/LRE family protein [Novosphingobium sp.]
MLPRPIPRETRDLLGEGPVWVPERNRLFWVDILAPALNWLDLASGEVGRRAFHERIGWIIPRAGRSDFVIGLKSGFHLFDLDAGEITPIGDPEPDRPDNRLNDAKVDHAGRIWAGTKDDTDAAATGALYRLDPDHRWSRHDDGYQVTNGPTFSPDGSTLYHTDSGARTIHAFDLAPDGTLANKRLFLRFEDAWGYPDGMTTDVEGCLWVAHWGAARISRFDPAGKLMHGMALPATNVTSMTFAGPDLDRMFVTSSADGLAHEPQAGALFEVDPGVRGLPTRAFAG